MRKRIGTRYTGQSLLPNCARIVLVALFLGLSFATLQPKSTSATLCPPGYEPGPSVDVVNGDGTVTRTPGPCVPKIITGGLSGGADDVQIDPNGPVLVDVSPTPVVIDVDGEDDSLPPVIDVTGDGETIDNPPVIDGIVTPTPAIDPPDGSLLGDNSLTVYGYTCPSDADSATASHYELAAHCQSAADGRAFHLASDSGSVLTQTMAGGQVAWGGSSAPPTCSSRKAVPPPLPASSAR